MSRKAPLRVVTEGDSSPRKPMTVKAAADTGSRRDLLVATRTRVAAAVDDTNTPARDLAALTRRLLDIAKEIESIDAHDEGDEVGNAAETPDEEWAAT